MKLFRTRGHVPETNDIFRALKALSHNYPNVMALCWEQISSIIYGVLSSSPDEPARLWRGNVEQTVAPIKERVMTAAVKVLDECLRAISGFKGTEDLSNDKSLDSPFTSDFVKTKAISSATSYSLESPVSTNGDSKTCLLASERWLEATIKHMPLLVNHSSGMVRAASVTCFAGMTSSVFFSLPEDKQEFIISSSINAALNDEVPSVRSAACRAIGVIAFFPQIYHSTEVLEKYDIHAAERNARDSLVSVKANAVRGMGNLARSIQFTKQLPVHGDPLDSMNSKFEYPDTQGSKAHMKERSHLFPTSSGGSDWLEQMVQAFLSCVTTGTVKVQWNVCHALSSLFLNKSLKLQDMDWVSSVFSILLLLLRDSSNFKIRIQAAASLAVPETIKDYGKSYYDVKSVVHVVESFKSDQISEPSNFKYWIALEKQLTSTMLHLLGLASRCDQRAMQDLLVKKASFLEVWIEGLCSSLGDTSNSLDEAKHVSVDQKKDVIFRTIGSLIEVYKSSNHDVIAQRFDKLGSSLL